LPHPLLSPHHPSATSCTRPIHPPEQLFRDVASSTVFTKI